MAEENENTENGESEESIQDSVAQNSVEEIEEQEQGEMNLDFILDIPLELSVELGKTRMLVNDLLQLGQGSIIELNKLAGESLEVYINHKLIARGEVVVVNEKFGVRLTDVITPIDRVKSLAAEE
ncbi:MAG: flagellar motor switch protein FliN [Deltaproteobacteria bacterium]|jgi:flagellar motor switch protein FliN/FliY|nr:flagellar motor switch protein FliN [Deltaproteobacteria bacterium]